MNYILKPSLEYMCLVKVAAALWNPCDVRDLMKKFPLSVLEYREKWSKIEGLILEKVPQLPLPEFLKEKALVFVRAVGREILNWILYHHASIFLDIGVPNELFWTPQGTIDRKKVAKVLVKDDAINIAARYKLACTYCLEDEIWELWDKIPEDRKDIFYSENILPYGRGHDLVVLWTYTVLIEVTKMECIIGKRFYLYVFECAAGRGSRVAVEYFFQKLTSGERKEFLMKTADYVAELHHIEKCSKEYYSDTLVYLLSQMEEEQQVELFKSCPCYVLECFLDWPRQIFFIVMCNRMWNFLPRKGYSVLLKGIARKLRDGCTDFNYQKLFAEMWRQGPKVHRDIIIRQPTFVSLLSTLCEIKDKSNIELIFQDAPRTKKKKFICSSSGNGACNNLIKNEAWDLLKFLVQECFSSKEEVMKFEKEFRKWPHDMILRNDFEKGKMKLDKFYFLLNDIVCGFSKRKCVEDDISEAKRFCNDF